MIGDVYITLDRNESDNINYNVIVGLFKYSEKKNNNLNYYARFFVKKMKN